MAIIGGLVKFIIRLLDSILDFIVLAVIVIMVLLAAYSLWDKNQVYEAAEAGQYAAYIPQEGDTRSFDDFVALNPEVIGWLRVNDTSINYPLVQAKDNMKYVNTDVEGNYSLSGAIFLDCATAPDFSEFNNVIYGHHMEKNRMFGDIGNFVDKDYFDSHPYGGLFFEGREFGIEFFAFMLVDAYDPIFARCRNEDALKQPYLDSIYEKAMHLRPMEITLDDHLVLLSTCTNSMTNGRHLLVGRLVGKQYPQQEDEKFYGFGVDALEKPSWELHFNWDIETVPLWILIIIAVLLLVILILLIIIAVLARKLRESRRREFRWYGPMEL